MDKYEFTSSDLLNEIIRLTTNKPAEFMKSSNKSGEISSFDYGNFTHIDFKATLETGNSKLSQFEEKLFGSIFSIVIILGIFGNLLVIWTVLFNKSMRTTNNLFILNLAISDLTLCFFSIPFNVYKTLRHTWIFGDFLCRLAPFFQASNVFVSSMSITAIALDRFVRIVYAMQVRQSNSLLRNYGAFLVLIFIWLFAFILSSPLFLFTKLHTLSLDLHNVFPHAQGTEQEMFLTTEFSEIFLMTSLNDSEITQLKLELDPNFNNDISTYKIYHCVENWPYHQSRLVYSYTSMLIQYIVPILIVGIAYCSIWCKLNKQRSKLKSHHKRNKQKVEEPDIKSATVDLTRNNDDKVKSTLNMSLLKPKVKSNEPTGNNLRTKSSNNRHRKMNVFLSCIAFIFAASWLPLNLFNILSDSQLSIIKADHSYYVLNAVCILLGMSSAVSNPVLNGVLNENFKREYHKIFSNFFMRFLSCFSPSGTKHSLKKSESLNENQVKYCKNENEELLMAIS